MMANYSGMDGLWVKVLRYGVQVTFFGLLALGPAQSATLYKCPGVGGAPQFQQMRCSVEGGAEVQVDTRTSSWRRVKSSNQPKTSKKKRIKSKKVSQSKPVSEASCWRAEKRKEKASRKLRRGYKPSQGERLRQRRRDAEEYLRRFCS